MPRPRKNGKPPRPVKEKATNLSLKVEPADAFLVWDTQQHGLALSVQPSGHKAYKCVYSFHVGFAGIIWPMPRPLACPMLENTLAKS